MFIVINASPIPEVLESTVKDLVEVIICDVTVLCQRQMNWNGKREYYVLRYNSSFSIFMISWCCWCKCRPIHTFFLLGMQKAAEQLATSKSHSRWEADKCASLSNLLVSVFLAIPLRCLRTFIWLDEEMCHPLCAVKPSYFPLFSPPQIFG